MIEYRDRGRNGRVDVIMTECPACGHSFPDEAGGARRSHISDHDPEDFGLAPLGEVTG